MNDNKMITQSRIIEEYGWTKSLISKFLPDPVLKANPHYRKAAPLLVQCPGFLFVFFHKKNILIDFQVIEQVQFLVNECNSKFFGLLDRHFSYLFFIKFNFAAVCRKDTGKNVHQR